MKKTFVNLSFFFVLAVAGLLMASYDPGMVAKTRKINGHALSGDITITAADVGLGSVQNVDQTNAGNLTSGSIPNARLANSSITVNSQTCTLGGSCSTTLTGTSATQNPGALLGGGCNNFTVTVTGATTGQTVNVSAIGGVDLGPLITVNGAVTSANTVTVHECAILAATPVSAQFRAVVQ